MKKLLYIDCNLRGEASRTRMLANYFLDQIDTDKFEIETVDLTELELLPLNHERLAMRDLLLRQRRTDHELFRYARQFAQADKIIISAPFWDLSFPAQLKLYIENISVAGITFGYNATGMTGLCRASELVFITTKGGIYKDSPLDCADSYMKALTALFGIGQYHCISAEGLDIDGTDITSVLNAARAEIDIAAGKF